MNKNYINSCLRWLANEVVPFYMNENLPEELMSKVDVFYKSVANTIDWFNLKKEDLLKLGFLNWNEFSDPADDYGVWFIPNWLFPVIPEGIMLWDKNEVPFQFHRQTAPKDVMYGCLTFGVVISKQEVKYISDDL